MSLQGAYVAGAVVLGLCVCVLAVLGLAALSDDSPDEPKPSQVRREERVAKRLLRARYARGDVGEEEYRRLVYELEEGRSCE